MQEHHLINLSLSSSIIGILFLFFLVQTTSIPESSGISVSFAKDGDVVKIAGPVRKITEYGNATRLEIIPQQPVSVIVFDNITLPNRLGDKTRVEITGRVERGKHGSTIFADEVKVAGSK